MSKDQEEDMIEKNQHEIQKSYKRGSLIVAIIAFSNIIFTSVRHILGGLNILSLIVQIGLSIALISGVRWVRWLFVAGATLNVVFSMYICASALTTGNQLPVVLICKLVLANAQAVISGSLLVFNKSVSDFFYEESIK